MFMVSMSASVARMRCQMWEIEGQFFAKTDVDVVRVWSRQKTLCTSNGLGRSSEFYQNITFCITGLPRPFDRAKKAIFQPSYPYGLVTIPTRSLLNSEGQLCKSPESISPVFNSSFIVEAWGDAGCSCLQRTTGHGSYHISSGIRSRDIQICTTYLEHFQADCCGQGRACQSWQAIETLAVIRVSLSHS